MTKAPRLVGDRTFAITLTALYAAWVLFVALHHEIWLDEADVWLASRDMTLRQIFSWFGAVGSPPLWYAIVMPFSKGGAPILAMTLIHVTFAIIAAGFFAFFAPFSRTVRCLVLFSYHLAYGFAVVARSYVLTVLLLFLIAAVWRGSRRRPVLMGVLLFLLANANTHSFFMAGVLWTAGIIDAVRRRDRSRATLAGIGIAFAGLLLSFLALLPPAGAQQLEGKRATYVIQESLVRGFVPMLRTEPLWILSGSMLPLQMAIALRIFGAIAGGAIVIGTGILLWRRPLALFAFAGCVAGLMYIYIFKWFGGERHGGLIFLLVIFGLWLAAPVRQSTAAPSPLPPESNFLRKTRRITFALLKVCLVLSCLAEIDYSMNDVTTLYSGGHLVAQFIADHGLQNHVIACAPDGIAGPVLPYLGRRTRFWLVDLQEFGSYMHWQQGWMTEVTVDAAIERIDRRFPAHDAYLLLTGKDLPDAAAKGYVPIYQTGAPVLTNEYYFLYAPVPRPSHPTTAEGASHPRSAPSSRPAG